MKPTHLLLAVGLRTLGRLSDGVRLGFATGFDSGTLVDYVYRNEAHGITPLGVLFDRLFLDHPVWRGVRARRGLLIAQLRDALARYERPTLFDVAAGPASYLFSLPRGRYLAGDISDAELARGADRAQRQGRDDIHFVKSDAFDVATWPRERLDVLVASGFFDILVGREDVERLLAAGSAATAAGARWVFTVMERHTDLRLLRTALVDFRKRPWVAVTRRAEDVVELAGRHGWRPERIEREAHGFFAVATVLRT